MTVVIAAACAPTLHGSDGSGLWLTIMSPHSSRPDVRGRQYAWLLLVGPYAVAVTVALTALPSSVLLFPGRAHHQPWLLWSAVPVDLLTGALLFQGLGMSAGCVPAGPRC